MTDHWCEHFATQNLPETYLKLSRFKTRARSPSGNPAIFSFANHSRRQDFFNRNF